MPSPPPELLCSELPRSSTSAFTKRARFAYAAIVAINKIPLKGNCDDAIKRRMALAWDGIRAWVAFIFTTRVAGLPESNPDRAPALEALVQILQFYISNSVLYKLLLRDISTHELAARLWIEWGSTKGSSDSDTFKDFKPVTAMFIGFMFQCDEKLWWPWFTRVQEITGPLQKRPLVVSVWPFGIRICLGKTSAGT